jgi:hypothetical protein
VHICPHCHKLGISTYAAIGDPFSRGLASCRYCHEVSKRRHRLGTNVVTPAAIMTLLVWVYFVHPPLGLLAFWFSVLILFAFVIDDRLIDFEKWPGESKVEATIAKTAEQR